ncbi:MAG: hypothetical protein JO057_08625 [Chloroflexi bacterium]|nr:hypothetical protein [Chloroflexota bacterium]
MLVDEWVETGAEMAAAARLVERPGGEVVGLATIHAGEVVGLATIHADCSLGVRELAQR